tara:strand:+ start:439 stop:660 length:222 start_codon:yes stop_codon:yes gene_type:complete
MRIHKFKDESITLSDGLTKLTAVRDGDFIIFSGAITGEHRINVMSSPARVQAHWSGYVQNAWFAAARAAQRGQ